MRLAEFVGVRNLGCRVVFQWRTYSTLRCKSRHVDNHQLLVKPSSLLQRVAAGVDGRECRVGCCHDNVQPILPAIKPTKSATAPTPPQDRDKTKATHKHAQSSRDYRPKTPHLV